jgi:hypothetical protein
MTHPEMQENLVLTRNLYDFFGHVTPNYLGRIT